MSTMNPSGWWYRTRKTLTYHYVPDDGSAALCGKPFATWFPVPMPRGAQLERGRCAACQKALKQREKVVAQ